MGDIADYVTATAAAGIIGVGRTRLDQLARDGKIPYVWAGPVRMFLRRDVEAFAKTERKPGRPKGSRDKKGRKKK